MKYILTTKDKVIFGYFTVCHRLIYIHSILETMNEKEREEKSIKLSEAFPVKIIVDVCVLFWTKYGYEQWFLFV